MKLAKSLLLGSAAGFLAVTGAQAADLPTRKAAPVDYVRICAVYGPGFFYIPGTDTCIKVGGRLRFEYQYSEPRGHADSSMGTNAEARIRLDARTATDWGLLRAYIDFTVRRRSGAWFGSGTATRMGNTETFQGTVGGFPSYAAIDTAGNKLESSAYLSAAFIQWGGLTAGRTQSFFDFYADNDNIIGLLDSDVTTEALAYTYTFGNGFSATLSFEDGIERRQPLGGSGPFGPGGPIFPNAVGPFLGNYLITFPGAANGLLFPGLNTAQRENVPDVVGALRVDQGWGSAQLSGAWHHISTSGSSVAASFGGIPSVIGGSPGSVVTSVAGGAGGRTANGYAVLGGVKINLPMIGPADHLYLEASYSKGGSSYVNSGYPGQESSFGNFGFGSAGGIAAYDAILDTTGRLKLTTAYSGTVSFLHYWTPTLRSAFFGSAFRETFGKGIKAAAGFAEGAGCPGCIGTITTATGARYNPFSPYYMDGSMWELGANLIWTPVKNLDIGVEAIYVNSTNSHRAYDTNKGYPFLSRADDQWLGRFRIQRDF